MKKRSFILFELLIALSLIALMLSILFRFFANSVKLDAKIDEARAVLSSREYLHTRLSHLFSSLIPRSQLPDGKAVTDLSFHTEGADLVTIFDQGVDPDPNFSGAVASKIFIDKEKNLILLIAPLEKKGPQRKEILLSGVDSVTFQFLAQKSLQRPSPNAVHINKTAEWRSQWDREETELPSLIRMKVSQDKEELHFAFLLPFPGPSVVYSGAK